MIGSVFFPLVEAERHTANINMVVAISAITSFLFIIDTVFESYNLVYACKSTTFFRKGTRRMRNILNQLKMREINEEYPIPPKFFMAKYPIPPKFGD